MPSNVEVAVCDYNFLSFSSNPVTLNDTSYKHLDVQYRMINSCPTGYIDDKIISKCENSGENIPESPDDIVVVSDVLENDEIYKNKHCAACNGVTNVIRYLMQSIV